MRTYKQGIAIFIFHLFVLSPNHPDQIGLCSPDYLRRDCKIVADRASAGLCVEHIKYYVMKLN